IIKVNPKKRMTFDPKESVDMQGQTGPYIQNAYVRIQSVLRKAKKEEMGKASDYHHLNKQEKDIVAQIFAFPELIKQAAEELDPSSIANYSYTLAKTYHRFYNDHSILRADSLDAKAFRLMLSQMVAKVLKTAMNLLGIEMPQRM
ncbi:MAG TPA: arginine--tRNA ligase, partial [Saprospiraceae bacterium]|nr:arginine--tRNA ligase [Saprospiraceae bacterium]